MQETITVFFLAVDAALLLLNLFPQSGAAQVAFAWVGPTPRASERWSAFQLRWALYSFWWLVQFAVLLCAVAYVPVFWPSEKTANWMLAALFALGLGTGVATLASVGFILKSLKARYLGPNPEYQELQTEKRA